MASILQTIHTNLGYLVVVVVLVAAVLARRASAEAPVSRATSLTMVLLDVHVTIGIALYVVGSWWQGPALIAYVHPVLALAALGVGHAALARARRERSPRVASTGLVGAFVLIVAAVGVASV